MGKFMDVSELYTTMSYQSLVGHSLHKGYNFLRMKYVAYILGFFNKKFSDKQLYNSVDYRFQKCQHKGLKLFDPKST